MLRDQIKPYISKIVSREISGREVARTLGVSESHLSRVLKQLKITREEAPNSKAKRELNAARREYRIFAANSMDIEAAARAAGCSTRTIYRLRNKK